MELNTTDNGKTLIVAPAITVPVIVAALFTFLLNPPLIVVRSSQSIRLSHLAAPVRITLTRMPETSLDCRLSRATAPQRRPNGQIQGKQNADWFGFLNIHNNEFQQKRTVSASSTTNSSRIFHFLSF